MADTIILSSLSRLVAPGDCVIANGWNFDANCYASIVRYADKSPTYDTCLFSFCTDQYCLLKWTVRG